MADYTLQYPGATIDALLGKVNNPDATPTANSENLVKSGGVKSYVDGKTGDLSQLQTTAKTNLVAAINEASQSGSENAVLYVLQNLTAEQKAQARANIDALSPAELDEMQIVTVTTLPTASASTMGNLYLVGPDENNNYLRYFTQKSGSSYSWVAAGSTVIVLSDYATKAELSQLDLKVNGKPAVNETIEKETTSGTKISATVYDLPVTMEAGRKYHIKVEGPGTLVSSVAFYPRGENGDEISCVWGGLANPNTFRSFTSVMLEDDCTPSTDAVKYSLYSSATQVIGTGTLKVIITAAATECLSVDVLELKNDVADLEDEVSNLDDEVSNLDKVLASRNEAAVDADITTNYINLSTYPIGAQFEVNVTSLSGTGDAFMQIDRGDNTTYYIPIKETGKYYLEKNIVVNAFRFIKTTGTGNVINFTVKKVVAGLVSPIQRFTPNYQETKFGVTSADTLNVGSYFKGYYDKTGHLYPVNYWVSSPFNFSNGYKIHLACSSWANYSVKIAFILLPTFDATGSIKWGWLEKSFSADSDIDITKDVYAWRVTIRRADYSTDITPAEVANALTITYVSGNIYEKTLDKGEVEKEIADSFSNKGITASGWKDVNRIARGCAWNPFVNNPQYYHFSPNGFIKDDSNHRAIASQSIEDVELAARLGFKFIEANIHQTSDGKFVCIHGTSGAFGTECKSADENVITSTDLRTTQISTKTLAWIKQYVRYDVYFAKYSNTIPSLEEFCQSCLKHGIGIFAGAPNKDAILTCIKLMNGNIILYNPPADVRDYFDGYVFQWYNTSGTLPATLLAAAKEKGGPYMCGLGPTLLSEFITNDVLADFVEDMHGSGFLVGATGTYDTEANWRKAQKAGCDFNCSGHDVNPFDANYEVYDTDTDNQPTTTGTNSNGIISLPEGGTITAGSASKIIGKGWLSIRFNGKLTIDFGSQGSNGRTIESDGSEDIVISDYFFMRATSLTITAVSTTSVSRFLYKTSKC